MLYLALRAAAGTHCLDKAAHKKTRNGTRLLLHRLAALQFQVREVSVCRQQKESEKQTEKHTKEGETALLGA